MYSLTEYIGLGRPTRGSETSQYPLERKSNETPLVVASERGNSPNQSNFGLVGVVGLLIRSYKIDGRRTCLERPTKEGDSPVF